MTNQERWDVARSSFLLQVSGIKFDCSSKEGDEDFFIELSEIEEFILHWEREL